MSGLKLLQQLLLPGVRRAKGAQRIAGKPGYYVVEPSEAGSDVKNAIRRAEKQVHEEAEMARRPGGVPSVTGQQRARHADMLEGALNELRYASEAGGSIGRPVKGLLYVDKGGNVRGGAALNTEKMEEHLLDAYDLDFTKIPDKLPNYLEYVSTTTPDVRGSELLRTLQDLYGPEMVFQVANPKKNVKIYEAMGAERMPLSKYGYDALGGHEGIPAFQLKKRIPERGSKPVDLEAAGQQRLPGFAEGGLVRLREMLSDPSTYTDAVKHAYQRNPFSDTEREHSRLYNRLGDELRREYGGKSGSITDRAKNYAGGWDYATRDPENAARRAELWQFKDYIMNPLSALSREDAGHDLDENLSGVRDALRFVGPPEPYKELKSRALRWAEQNPRGR